MKNNYYPYEIELDDLYDAFADGKEISWEDKDGNVLIAGSWEVVIKVLKYRNKFQINGQNVKVVKDEE